MLICSCSIAIHLLNKKCLLAVFKWRFFFLFQIRLTNGQTLTETFNPKEQLSAVRLYIEMHRSDGDGPFSLMTNFPKKVFQEEDYDKPLDILGETKN